MTNIYQNLYDMINEFIFGKTIEVGSYQDLVTIILSTIFCLALVYLPFWFIFRLLGKVFK